MFDLEPVTRYRLQRPPLVQALGQVRYPVRARLQTLEGIAPVQDELAEVFPYMEQQNVQQVSLTIGQGGPSSKSQITQTWRFTDDNGWSLDVGPDTANLAIGPEYGNFKEFESRFRSVVAALASNGGVNRCDRLGLRYVDFAPIPSANEHAWKEWFRPEITGWSATNLIRGDTRTETSLTQTQLAASPTDELAGPPVDIQATIRHGFVPANAMMPGVLPGQIDSPAFLLDVDLFVDGHQPFDATELTRQIGVLHDQIDRFFRWALAPGGEEYFGLEEIT